MKKKLRIGILGISGRMGRILLEMVNARNDIILSGVTERKGHKWIGKDLGELTSGKKNKIIVASDLIEIISDIDVVIDFTSPQNTINTLELVAQARIAHIIGTTGFNNKQFKKINIASKHAVIVKAGNMSMGINLITQITEKISSILSDEFDIEILDYHHNQKLDSPSGTSIMLGESAAKGRKVKLENVSDFRKYNSLSLRKKGEIGFTSIRGGDIVGEHEVIFAGPGERLVFRHVASSRSIFARGAIKAAIWCRDKKPGLYNMNDVLKLWKWF